MKKIFAPTEIALLLLVVLASTVFAACSKQQGAHQ